MLTINRLNSIWNKARELQDENILFKIQGFEDECIDIPANDVQYHVSSMNTFMNMRKPSGNANEKSIYEDVFHNLMKEIEDPLLQSRKVYHVTSLRNRYKAMLMEHGIKTL